MGQVESAASIVGRNATEILMRLTYLAPGPMMLGAAMLLASPESMSADPKAGYSNVMAKQLLIYNCNNEKDPRTYWVQDSKTSSWKKVHTAGYDGPESFGTCPAEGKRPYVLTLEHGVVYNVWAYDDGSEHPGQCSAADLREPPLTNCLDWWIGPVIGNASGQDVTVNFP